MNVIAGGPVEVRPYLAIKTCYKDMKTTLLFRWLFMAGAVFLGLIALMSCEHDELWRAKKDLKASRRRWEQMKRAKGDSYVYRTRFASFAPRGSNTEIRVEKGRVTSRSFYVIDFIKKDTTHVYTESAAELGTHKEGDLPLTIDELYDRCARDFLAVDPKQNDISFETDTTGLLSICGYMPKGYVDGHLTGVHIAWIRWEK